MSATLDFQLSKTNLRIGDTLQAPSLRSAEQHEYAVYYIGVDRVYLGRDIHVRDKTGWLQPYGRRYVPLEIAGLRRGERLKRKGHTGEYVVKNVIYIEDVVIVTEYIELTDLAGWTVVRPN